MIKNKTHPSVVYEKHILALKIGTILEEKNGQEYSKQMGPGSKEALIILISDKTEYKLTLIRSDKEAASVLSRKQFLFKMHYYPKYICGNILFMIY